MRREGCSEGRPTPIRIIVVHHEQQHSAIGIRHVPIFPLVAALVDDHIAAGEAWNLLAACKGLVDLEKIGQTIVFELAEERVVGVTRKCTAGFTKRGGFVVAVRVDVGNTTARHVVGMLQLAASGIVVIVALGERDARKLVKVGITAPAGRVQSTQSGSRVAEPVIHFPMQRRVDQAHAGRDILPESGRRPKVLAEHHAIIAALIVIEDGIAVVVPIGITAGHVELPLRLAEKPFRAAVDLRLR